MNHAFLCLAFLALCAQAVHAEPPFSGTIYIDPDIITSAEPERPLD